jgi:hypothetical protein
MSEIENTETANTIQDAAIVGPVVSLVPAVALSEQVREYVRASKAESTIRGYESDWRDFCSWCKTHGLQPLPSTAEGVATYIAECAGFLKAGSIQRRLNAITEAHWAMGLDSPTHYGHCAKHDERDSEDTWYCSRSKVSRIDR